MPRAEGSGMTDSILDAAPMQPALPLDLCGPIEPTTPELAARLPVFTGERVHRDDPHRYSLAARLFFESGLGQMQIAGLLAMSPQTIAAIIHREQDSMSADRLRDVQARRLAAVVSLASGAMVEALSDPHARARMSLRDLAYASQVATQAAALLRGEATSRVGHGDAQASGQVAAAEYLSSLRPADVRELPRQPISEPDSASVREAAPVVDQAGAPGDPSTPATNGDM